MPKPHIPTLNQSFGIRVVKIGVSAALCITKCIVNGPDKEGYFFVFAQGHFLYTNDIYDQNKLFIQIFFGWTW